MTYEKIQTTIKLWPGILSPKVNEEIWCKLNTNAKLSDFRLYALQDTLVKATGAIVSTINGLLEHGEKNNSSL